MLEYFGSNTSHIQRRAKCCDNCDRGSSLTMLSDKYENIDNNGYYDFTENAYLLLKAMQITSKSSVAIPVLRGSSEKNAIIYKNDKQIYGRGKIWPKEYWSTLIQQLKCDDYLTTKPLPPPYRALLIISDKGQNWLKNECRNRLILKAIPEFYQYLVKKRRVNLNENIPSNNVIQIENNEEKSAISAVELHDTVEQDVEDNTKYLQNIELNDKHLEEILLSIRKALAEKHDCTPFSVASNIAIQQLVDKKPLSIIEFKSCFIDGFSVAKIEKFATPFINAIIKFRVS